LYKILTFFKKNRKDLHEKSTTITNDINFLKENQKNVEENLKNYHELLKNVYLMAFFLDFKVISLDIN
jgi:hypothetical protein